MPFGLKNAPATFQRAMDVILASVNWKYALVYLDDIVIFSNTFEEHLQHFRSVLQLLQTAGVSLRLDKCTFFTKSINYLGHVVRPGKLAAAMDTCKAVEGFPEPRTITDVRSFLGLCNVFRRFVKDFARIAAPLNAMLKKDRPATFDDLTDDDFNIDPLQTTFFKAGRDPWAWGSWTYCPKLRKN